jgi:hypothetical protein
MVCSRLAFIKWLQLQQPSESQNATIYSITNTSQKKTQAMQRPKSLRKHQFSCVTASLALICYTSATLSSLLTSHLNLRALVVYRMSSEDRGGAIKLLGVAGSCVTAEFA